MSRVCEVDSHKTRRNCAGEGGESRDVSLKKEERV